MDHMSCLHMGIRSFDVVVPHQRIHVRRQPVSETFTIMSLSRERPETFTILSLAAVARHLFMLEGHYHHSELETGTFSAHLLFTTTKFGTCQWSVHSPLHTVANRCLWPRTSFLPHAFDYWISGLSETQCVVLAGSTLVPGLIITI